MMSQELVRFHWMAPRTDIAVCANGKLMKIAKTQERVTDIDDECLSTGSTDAHRRRRSHDRTPKHQLTQRAVPQIRQSVAWMLFPFLVTRSVLDNVSSVVCSGD